ncbi:hypothetical protein [Bacillus sp. AR18-7]|uniref:hypothetical protein n=1 Tax=Bacillus sp. AR18-7 TaxID=2217821 RepID=UPI0011C7C51D|nr:hypothetical protein [Bacillus sp. AR18-7]TXR62165.1 hypothetical protein DN395_16790 [Bacillus sp. AR18-7]
MADSEYVVEFINTKTKEQIRIGTQFQNEVIQTLGCNRIQLHNPPDGVEYEIRSTLYIMVPLKIQILVAPVIP